MKKGKFFAFMLSALICLQTSTNVFAMGNAELEQSLKQLHGTQNLKVIENNNDRPIYLFPPYAENSTEGYTDQVTINGKQYMMRIREAQQTAIAIGPLYNNIIIAEVAAGQTQILRNTVINSKSTSITKSMGGGVSASFFGLIKKRVDKSISGTEEYVVTKIFEKETQFTFPNIPETAGCNNATFYNGFVHDEYRLTVDYAPIESMEQLYKVLEIRVIRKPRKPIGPRDDRSPYDPDEPTLVRYKLQRPDGSIFYRTYDIDDQPAIQIINGVKYISEGKTIINYNNKITDYTDYLIPHPVTYVKGIKI